MTGYTREELIGKTSQQLGMVVDEESQDQIAEEIMEKGRTHGRELSIRQKDGTIRHGLFFGEIIQHHNSRFFLTLMIDITRQRALEEERLEMQKKLQRARRMESLGILAGGIAHDFNNLLTVSLGHADLALEKIPGTSQAIENIHHIQTASRTAAELCRQMLAYAGRGKFTLEKFDPGSFLLEIGKTLRTSISPRASLTIDSAPGLPLIEGDRTELAYVCNSLVVNSSESFKGGGGSIILTAGEVNCTGKDFQDVLVEGTPAGGRHIYIEVSDNGCGMDSGTLERLFEPLFTTKFAGRGLGMSATMGIVLGHRGFLTVNSHVNRGTIVRVYLPLAAVDEDPPSMKEVPGDAGGNTILLVDDEEMLLTLGGKLLEKLGYNVLTASNGVEALEVYSRNRDSICLTILDLTMPEMDGEETFNEMNRLYGPVNILMTSGYSNGEIEKRFMSRGLLGVIQKPYSSALLKGKLQSLASQGLIPEPV